MELGIVNQWIDFVRWQVSESVTLACQQQFVPVLYLVPATCTRPNLMGWLQQVLHGLQQIDLRVQLSCTLGDISVTDLLYLYSKHLPCSWLYIMTTLRRAPSLSLLATPAGRYGLGPQQFEIIIVSLLWCGCYCLVNNFFNWRKFDSASRKSH